MLKLAPQLFVTGTDTGVGKTVVSAALARAFRERGVEVGVLKPIETGWPDVLEPGAPPTDGARLRDAAGDTDAIELVVPVRLPEPLAPFIAAERAGTRIDFDGLVARANEKRRRCGLLLMEGAGGLLVPLDETRSTLDLIVALGAPVLVVAANRLGVINHTLLTVARLDAARVSVAGVVLNRVGPESDLARSLNPAYLARALGSRYLGELAWLGEVRDPSHAARALAASIPLDAVWSRLAVRTAS